MGVRFGVFGMIGAFCLTAGILWFAWYFGSWRGIAFVMPFLVMNMFDYSMDYPGVWIPFLIGLLYLRLIKLQNVTSVL
jgi:hypothetical protein